MKEVKDEDLEVGKIYDIGEDTGLKLQYFGVWYFPKEEREVRIFRDTEGSTYSFGFISTPHPTLGEVIPFPIEGSNWWEID